MMNLAKNAAAALMLVATLAGQADGAVSRPSCATYNNRLADGSVGFCAGLIDYKFYLPENLDQEMLEAQLGQQLAAGGAMLSIVPPRCGAQLKKTLCAATFQKCELVDPWFLDTSCNIAIGEVCIATGVQSTACMVVSPPSAPVPKDCVPEQNKVFGTNLTWAEAAYGTPGSPPVPVFCAYNNLTYSADTHGCLVPVPISPKKSMCDELHSADTTLLLSPPRPKATCPLVSGLFYSFLLAKVGVPVPALAGIVEEEEDPYAKSQFLNALVAKGCDNATDPVQQATCPGAVFEINMFSAFGVLPSCSQPLPGADDVYLYSESKIQEQISSNRLGSRGLLIGARAVNLAPPDCQGINCSAFLAKLQPNEDVDLPVMQPGVAYADEVTGMSEDEDGTTAVLNPQCAKLVKENGKNEAAKDLLILGGGVKTADVAKGAFVVPATSGLPPLPHMHGFVGNDMASPYAPFLTQPDGGDTTPLCTNKVAGHTIHGRNSLECVINRVNSAMLPGWVNPKCRSALTELVCSSAHMKPSVKRLCLVPKVPFGGCADTDVEGLGGPLAVPFVFALPRFASKGMCIHARTECAPFLSYLNQTDKATYATLNSALDCDQTLPNSCDATTGWQSQVWPCSGPSTIKLFPESAASLVDLSALSFLQVYQAGLAANSMTLETPLTSLFATTPVTNTSGAMTDEELLATCQCPEPLVVPKKLPKEGSQTEFVCCSDICTTSTFTPDTFQFYYNLQFYISIPSFICAGFVFLTFISFKAKRQQRLTLFFSVTSMIIALLFIITTFQPRHTDLYCKSETEPITQTDGGLCIFQAWGLTFFTVAACGWWFCQALDLYLKVVLNRRVDYIMYYHAIAWGLPTFFIIIYAGTNSYGYSGPQPWCFSSPVGIKELEYILFYAPISLYTLLGFILMVSVIYKIFTVTQAGQAVTQTKQSSMKRLATFRTPALFVFFFLFVWTIIFSWRFKNIGDEPIIRAGGIAWFSCLLTNFANGISDPATNSGANTTLLVEKFHIEPNSGCGLSFPYAPSLTMMTLIHVVAFLQGVFIFFIFGARIEIMHLWAERLHLTSNKYDTTDDPNTSQKGGSQKGGKTTAKGSSMILTTPRGDKDIKSNQVASASEE